MVKAGDGKQRSDRRKRNQFLQKRVSNDELTAFKERAFDAGFNDHRDYLTAFIFGEIEIDRRELHDLIYVLRELEKHARNLNQLAHTVDTGTLSSLTTDKMTLIKDTRVALQAATSLIREKLENNR